MNLRDKFGLGYIILSIFCLGASFILGYGWMFIPWFTVTCLFGVLSWINTNEKILER